ncbi:hypothetical protein IKG20_02180 [Candidatus Saccharibacteria bacterium]|nr:hypothetical protein [Candidatus Saccharibacteria bacterium]
MDDNNQPKPNIDFKKSDQKEERTDSGSSKASKKPDSMIDTILAKIKDADSVLVALSNDPTVDEIAAAMGLSMALDSAGKHVTAIYSGKTPNVLEFLKPEERFETGTESLQDFVIALNKDKADHLRYKIDGDFVKVYVTPYKTTISGDDIEFSRGDFNVDLVISLNVPAATELDAALKEHGRIMHDATCVNITNGAAGKFGDVEWVDQSSSSISEMVAKLVFELEGKIDAPTATALLTGLVAATDRFSNPATTPEVMVLAAKLMGAGADQQLVAQNVQGEVVFNGGEEKPEENTAEAETKVEESEAEKKDDSSLEISHGDEKPAKEEETPVASETLEVAAEQGAQAPAEEKTLEPIASEPLVKDETESAPEPSLSPLAGEETPASAEASTDVSTEASTEASEPVQPLSEASEPAPASAPEATPEIDPVQAAMQEAMNPTGALGQAPMTGTVAGVDVAVVPENADGYAGGALADQILSNIEKENSNVGSADYGKMIDEALNEPLPGEGGIQVGANGPGGPQVDTQDVEKVGGSQGSAAAMMPGGDAQAALGAQMMANAGQPQAASMQQPVETGMTEEEALDVIKQAQAEANAALPGMPENGELPKIVPTEGSLGYESPIGAGVNPAAEAAPSVGTDLNASAPAGISAEPGPMPMPGQEMAPPPVLPQPDFGTMPPTEMPDATPPVMEQQVGNTVPVPETVPTPDVTVMPDMNAPITAMNTPSSAAELPQMPMVGGAPAGFGNEAVGMQTGMGNFQSQQQITDSMNSDAPADPSAFKIPGIHT